MSVSVSANSPEEIQQAIDTLSALDLSNASIEEIKGQITILLKDG